ncbi:3-dehydroquinate synthase [Petroclostridium sp. X23]|uniref:3-dehydroquinate synthase n=1 Tax=Petroclostridium sp. X23 TaxID=3045146 RepID=UPI0024AC9972|nr:3-dehydroquinate synthase [Petroclostridium sp. X23]WHH59546.1 3-dehydroquinate synthase [Petroclostridium sp. X23]
MLKTASRMVRWLDSIKMDFNERSYSIYFEENFSSLPQVLKEKKITSKILIVTDSNVDKHYGNQLYDLLINEGFSVYKHVFEAGEQNKHLATISSIYDTCLANRLDRGSAVIALGGGVTGDIAGFAASTYMRGIKFIQVPTSLLAQVDSSVGGKVGVDYKGTKNIIGSFYQPSLVYMNLSVLQTLPEREYISGMAEIIKHGIIYDNAFFEYLEQNMGDILNLDMNTLKHVVRKNCLIKSQVVQQDETEQGLRAILNFGHTIGHAIETVLDFRLLHGECVAIGMIAAAYIGCRKKMFREDEMDRIIALLKRAGLPVNIKDIDYDKIHDEMLKDKKQVDNKLKFILPTEIGKVMQTTEVTKEDIYNALEYISI